MVISVINGTSKYSVLRHCLLIIQFDLFYINGRYPEKVEFFVTTNLSFKLLLEHTFLRF